MPFPAPDPGPSNPPTQGGHQELHPQTSGPWDPVGVLWNLGDALYRLGNVLNDFATRINSVVH